MRERSFTSSINAEIAPGAEAQFLRLERMADRTFNHIQARAALAARATGGLVGGGIGTAGARTGMGAGAEATRIAAANAAITRSSALTTSQLARQSSEIGRLERRNAAMVQGLRSTATALQVVQGPLGPIAGRITALSNAMERLTGLRLGMATVGASLFALTAAANRAAEIRSKLVPLYETQNQVNDAFRRTASIARDTRSALEPVVDLYSRLTMVGRDIGLSPLAIERTTRSALLGARVSGGSRQAQQAAITQLAQGIGSNRLGGEELRSILEQAPRIAKAIADGLSNTENFGRVTIGMLRNLGAEGELTAERVAGALGRELHTLEEEARRLGPTMASSMSAFGTEFTVAVNSLDQAVGLTRTLATAIQFAADNMREITALVLGLGTAWAVMKIAPQLPARIEQMRGFIHAQREAFDVQRNAATAEARAARDSITNLARRSDSLKQQRTYIEANTRALEAQVAVQRRQVARLAPQAALGGGVVGGSGVIREHREAVERLRQSEERLGRQYQVLNGIQISQANNTRNLTTATERLSRAQLNAARVASRLRMVGSALIGVINPLGIAVSILTVALFELAMAESRAERNARRLEEMQRELAASVDETTGRIREQNAELRRGLSLRSREAEGRAAQQFLGTVRQTAAAAREQLRTGSRAATREERETGGRGRQPVYLGGAGGRMAQDILNRLAAGQMNPSAAAQQLRELADRNPNVPALREAAEMVSRALPDITTQGRDVMYQRAYQRELRGEATENDRRILRGDFTGGRVEGRSPADLNRAAEAERARLRDPRYRARTTMEGALADLDVRRGQMSSREFISARAQILHTYDQEIDQIQRAEAASGRRAQGEENRAERQAEAARERREQLDNLMQSFQDDAPVRQLERVFDQAERAKRQIRDLVGEQVEGIGRFTAAQAEARIAQVEQSVRRQSRAFLDQTMERFTDDTPVRRMRELATAAREARRDIDALVGQAVEGYESAFSQDDANRLKSQIDDFVRAEQRRPLTDAFRSFDEQLRVQQLMLQGREAEAEALQEMFSLQQQMGPLTEAEYQQLVRNAEQQRFINDLLAERQRVVENLTSVTEDARRAIEDTLGHLSRGRLDRAARDLFEQMTESFVRVRIRQLTNRLMEGTDARIRDLVNGRTRVDIAVDSISGAMTTAGGAATRLADALEGAAARIEATDIAGTAAAATAPATIDAVTAAITSPQSPIRRLLSVAAPLASMIVGGDSHAAHLRRGSHGVDLRARPGTDVHAPFAGNLTFGETQRGGLQAFITSLDGRMRAGFAHLSAYTVANLRQGMRVEMGQVFARTGNTGINPRTGQRVAPHLHSSLYVNGRPVNPMDYYGRRVDLGGAMAGARAAADFGLPAGAPSQRLAATTSLISAVTEALDEVDRLAGTNDRRDRAVTEMLGDHDVDWRNARDEGPPRPMDEAAAQRRLGTRELYNTLGRDIGRNIDEALGTRFAEKVGGKLGDVVVGAGKGQMASGVVRMLGVKQSNMGAGIGGAIGQLAAPLLGPLAPFAPFIGGIIGGTIGGMFKKSPRGSTTVSVGQFGDFVTGGTSGSSNALRAAADALGGSVGSGLQQIAEALYGTISGTGKVSIGQRKDKFVVDPTGRGRTKGSGVMKFDTEQEAVEAAIRLMIQQGVIGGISAASSNILRAGKDLQTAIQKAAAIESIPRRLMQLQDPVRFAVMELNREFERLIMYLKEGGASAEQYAQAEQLYQLERQQAIEQAKNAASDQIQSFLDDMMGGSNSPLNRRTVYTNAREQIDRFTADVMGGKVVDQGKLLEAARNFQEASRALQGSGAGFFADFDWLFELLTRARNNVNAGAGTDPLPGSPFANDPQIAAMVAAANGTSAAVNTQTEVLGNILTDIRDLLLGGSGAGTGSSAIPILPGFGGGGTMPGLGRQVSHQ